MANLLGIHFAKQVSGWKVLLELTRRSADHKVNVLIVFQFSRMLQQIIKEIRCKTTRPQGQQHPTTRNHNGSNGEHASLSSVPDALGPLHRTGKNTCTFSSTACLSASNNLR